MSEFGNVAFDPETLAILEGVFDDAWVSIQAQRNGNITRAALAERMLSILRRSQSWKVSLTKRGCLSKPSGTAISRAPPSRSAF
jgi:hypothetical protein